MAKAKRPYASRRRIEPRVYDFARLKVRSIHVAETGPIIGVALSESDLVLVGVAIGEAYQMADLPLGAVVQHPIREIDSRPILEVHVPALPGGLCVGQFVNLSAILTASVIGDTWIVTTTAKRVRIRRERLAGGAPITMPRVGSLKPPPTDAELAATLIHAEVPDDSVALDETDAAILAEMRRIQSNGLPRWMSTADDDDRLRSRIVRFVNGPGAPRQNGLSLAAILRKFANEPRHRVRAAVEGAVARGEILALRRSVSRGVLASSVGLYVPKPPSAA